MLWCVSRGHLRGAGSVSGCFRGRGQSGSHAPHPAHPHMKRPVWLNGSSSETIIRSETSEADCDSEGIRAAASTVHLKPSLEFGEDLYKMPRSFLVKKYFSNKKPNYSELESQTGECAKRYLFISRPMSN